MSRIECKWGKTKDFAHLHSIRLMWSTASELGLRNPHSRSHGRRSRQYSEGSLTYSAWRKALETFQNDKFPNEDGLPSNFIIFLWSNRQWFITRFKWSTCEGELNISQRRGIIKLIPKEDESLLELSNWTSRPITLLKVDFKIAAKAIAKRLEPILPSLIHSDQTGFVKGHYTGENIRLINDIMAITIKQILPGLSRSLDFQKAFDSLKLPFIM